MNIKKKHDFFFHEYLVGLTDGDGCFSFTHSKPTNTNTWDFVFQISLIVNNIQILHKIKKELQCGTITISDNMATFRVRNKKHLETIILPIFDKYPLMTIKYYDYIHFKKGLTIFKNPSLTSQEKNKLLQKLYKIKKNKNPSISSPLWSSDEQTNIKLLTKGRIVGFIEAEGSFFITKNKNQNRYLHEFSISQKYDALVLEIINKKFRNTSKVCYKQSGHYRISCRNSRVLNNIIKYFEYNDKSNVFHGKMSKIFAIWSKSFTKAKLITNITKRVQYLKDCQTLIKNIRNEK